MTYANGFVRTLVLGLVVCAHAWGQDVSMDVRQGPDAVFASPLETLVPQLVGAMPTNRNGRVGNELVFWGYELEDGRSVYLVACKLQGVDCEERIEKICPLGSAQLSYTETEGLVRHVRCRNVALAAPGDIRPGCTDREFSSTLGVWLIQCS